MYADVDELLQRVGVLERRVKILFHGFIFLVSMLVVFAITIVILT